MRIIVVSKRFIQSKQLDFFWRKLSEIFAVVVYCSIKSIWVKSCSRLRLYGFDSAAIALPFCFVSMWPFVVLIYEKNTMQN